MSDKPINSNLALDTMSSIANYEDLTSNTIETSDVSLNKFKLFLVAQAKNELRRIVKLTTFLDQVEDNFVSINRSNDLISAVMSDDKLNSFVFNINTGDMQNNKFGLDIDSRTRVRATANNLLAMLTAKAESPTEDNKNSEGESTDSKEG